LIADPQKLRFLFASDLGAPNHTDRRKRYAQYRDGKQQPEIGEGH
jgi:hypothetical protein